MNTALRAAKTVGCCAAVLLAALVLLAGCGQKGNLYLPAAAPAASAPASR